MVLLLPSRSNSCSCNARSNFGCSSRLMSPISSRNNVPRSAISKRPRFCIKAPVNAPFSCPNSSLSTSPDGIAAQLRRTNVRSRLGLRLWTARAISSFPVPVSPCSKTVDPVGATISIWSRTLRRAALLPTRSSKLYSARISDSRYKRSSSRRFLDALSRPYASALSNAKEICALIWDKMSRSSCPKLLDRLLPRPRSPRGPFGVPRGATAKDAIFVLQSFENRRPKLFEILLRPDLRSPGTHLLNFLVGDFTDGNILKEALAAGKIEDQAFEPVRVFIDKPETGEVIRKVFANRR